MNSKLFISLIILSVFLSACNVYQTLYNIPSPVGEVVKIPDEDIVVADVMEPKDLVYRVEGPQSEENLEKTVYASTEAVKHDPFKVGDNPLGPFEKGDSLGFTLGDWLSATGSGTYTVDGDEAEMDFEFENLIPESVYTIWCSRITFPPEPKIVDFPCGAEDGSENKFESDEDGNAEFYLELEPLEQSSEKTASIIALAYHSDGETYEDDPGDFGYNSHVQIFQLLPILEGESYEAELEFVNHIQADFPEQDVFIEQDEVIEEVIIEIEEITEDEETEEEILVVEEEEETVVDEAATVIIVEETELISLIAKAEDPDQDAIEFIFSSPLDDSGEWQTDYGDSGEYTVTVTVSDGELTTSIDVLIIINKKEEVPTIDRFTPDNIAVTADESEIIEFNIEVSDLNDDELSFVWKLDGIEVSDKELFSYETNFDDAGSHTVKVTVSDGTLSADNLWSVTVNNVNRKPVLEEISDITVEETETVSIKPEAFDPDGDEISFTISDPVGNDDVWETTYDDSGEYTVTVTASDGVDEVSQEVTIIVNNVNRPPKIIEIRQK